MGKKKIFYNHCVKSVHIRSYSGPHFPAFGLNKERYEVSLRIQCKYGKIPTKITPNTNTFHAVNISLGYYVGGKFLSSTEKKISVKWFIKIINCGTPTYSHDENLSGLTLLANSVRQGFDVRTVSKAKSLISVIPLNNVRISLNTVYGQNVDAFSKEISENQVIFKSNAFRVFTMFSSKNTITREYWDLVTHRSHGYSKKTFNVDWFADTQWKQVYAHTKSGFPLCGSLDELLSAILDGRRVRFQLPDSSVYTAEADIRNGHVTAQALKLVGEKGETDFDKKGISEWLMVSTTGIFYVLTLCEKCAYSELF